MAPPSKSINKSASPAALILTAAILLALWGVLILRGFPFPYVDDCFYVGAALNLANGGGLENPLLENFGPFYFYPPGYSFFLAAWLKLFGISSASVVMFHGLLCWSATWFTIRTFQIKGREFLGWMMVLTLVIYFTCVGLRADAASFFFLSLALRLAISPRLECRVLAPLLAMFALVILPATLALVVPGLIFLLAREKSMWGASLAAGIVTLLLTGWMLDWHFGDFWSGMAQGAHESRQNQTHWIFGNWYRPMGMIKLILPVLACFSLIGLTGSKRGFRLVDGLMALSILLGVYATFNSVSGQRIVSVVTVFEVGFYAHELGLRAPWKKMLMGGVTLLVLAFEVRSLVQGISEEKPSNGPALLQQTENLHPSRLIIDFWSLRYVFDYKIRPGMLAFAVLDRPLERGAQKRKYPDECWVISAESVANFGIHEPGMPVPVPVTFRGKALGSWLKNPGELALLPPTAP